MSRDIYSIRRKRPDSDEDIFRQPVPPKSGASWDAAMRRQRVQSILTFVLLLVVVSLVIVISFQQYLLSSSVNVESALSVTGAFTGTRQRVPATRLGQDEQSVFLLEELRQFDLSVPEGDEPTPLHAKWIKTATYHILQAEVAQRLDQPDQAIAHYYQALRLFPSLQGIYSTIGMIYMEREEFAKAAEALEHATRTEPMTFGLANNLAVAYLQLQRLDEAEEALRESIALRPDYAAAYFNLATLYVREHQPQKAAPLFATYLQLEPNQLNAAMAYAATLIELQDWETAAQVLRHAEHLAPDSPPVLFRLAQSLGKINRGDEAIPYLLRAVRLVDSRHALGWMSRSEFDPLRDNPAFQQLVNELGEGR